MLIDATAVARLAGLIAERSRAAMCLALLDGRAWTAGELATQAGISRSTASAHLTELVDAGVLCEERQGKHRYVRLAGPEIAQALEDLGAFAGVAPRPSSLRAVRAAGRLAGARTCYDHLAGTLGVGLYDALVNRRLLELDGGLAVTPAGRTWCAALDPDLLRPSGSRPLVRLCLDWTERRQHLGGALGARLCSAFGQRGWTHRAPGDRAVTVTAAGATAFAALLGLPR